MAELGAVAAGLQITGQIFSLIKDLHNLKKGFTEAKTKHQSDLIEVQNILKVCSPHRTYINNTQERRRGLTIPPEVSTGCYRTSKFP